MAAEAEAAREARAKVYKNTNCSISITYINNIISYYIELLVSLVIIHVGDCSRGWTKGQSCSSWGRGDSVWIPCRHPVTLLAGLPLFMFFHFEGGLNFLLGWYKRKFNSDAKMHNSRICSQIYIIVKVKQLKSFFWSIFEFVYLSHAY